MLYSQLSVHQKPLTSRISLVGKTALITGANTGIGFEASRQLLQLGLSHLILAVRSKTSGNDAALKLTSEYPGRKVDVWLMDMLDPASLVALATRCRTLDRLDIAILNAGVQLATFKRCSATGHEMTMQINYLSSVLLAMHLAHVMKEAKKAGREQKSQSIISIVGSDTMYMSKLAVSGLILPYLDDETRYTKFEQYTDSKMLLMMFVSRLAEMVSPENVIINVSNPGMTAGTGFGKDEKKLPLPVRLLLGAFVKLVGRTVSSGASVYIHAVAAVGKESHGSFRSNWTIKPYPRQLYTQSGKEMRQRLWAGTLEDLKSFMPDSGLGNSFTFTHLRWCFH